jgi:transmembrane sensor
MQYDLEHVRMMMMEKISGTLEESEDKALQQMIRDDDTIAGLWEKLQARLAEPAAAEVMNSLPGRQERVWANVDEQVSGLELVTSPFPFARIAAAACFLLAAAGGVFFYRSAHRGVPLASVARPSAVPSRKKSIQLQLAGGNNIDLSAAGSTINIQEAKLNNTNKTLSFQTTQDRAAGLNTLTVPVGMDYKIVLADSTEVWMNSATVLQFPFAFRGNTRCSERHSMPIPMIRESSGSPWSVAP